LGRVINGGLAGLIATAPMTWTMRFASRLLPWNASRRLPPRQITEATLVKGTDRPRAAVPEPEVIDALSTLSHYAYGASCGAVLGALVARRWPASKPVAGAAFGAAIWAASYLGWLPAAGLRKNALHDHKERSVQLIAAHLVWGALAATLIDELGVEDRRQ
jgi:uncharacterized membrane protein YagU involved in acid resistance